jgi:hypothetical protein
MRCDFFSEFLIKTKSNGLFYRIMGLKLPCSEDPKTISRVGRRMTQINGLLPNINYQRPTTKLRVQLNRTLLHEKKPFSILINMCAKLNFGEKKKPN